MVIEGDTFQSQIETSPPKSILEHLPDELLIYVFEFLPYYDLDRAVYNLNSRLNKICQVLKLYLDLACTKSDFDDYCCSQRSLTSQVYRLKLSDEYDRLTVIHQIIDISIFTNLRALTIIEPSPENFDKILSKLHLLIHLFYLNIYKALIQSSHITTMLFSLSSLKDLIIYSHEPIIFNFTHETIRQLTALEYLEIDGCYMVEVLELLKYVGSNLKRMKIYINYKRPEDPESIDEKIIDSLLCGDDGHPQIPVSLNHVHMSFNYLSLTDSQLVLKLFPNLKHLTLSTLNNDLDFISSTIWHQFISENLLELEKFQSYIRFDKTLNPNIAENASPEYVYSYNNIDSKWINGPVIMDYNFQLDPPLLEFYSYSQPSHDGRYIVEFYGKKRYTATINEVINIDKNMTTLKITLNDDQPQSNEFFPIYPKVTTINIHSQMTVLSMDNESKNNLICSDIKKSIPDLSKITTLEFKTHSPISSVYPSVTLSHCLLVTLTNISTLYLSYNYLLQLIKSSSIIQKLGNQIDFLSITFNNDSPSFEDIIRIINIFSKNLNFIYFKFYIDFPYVTFYLILPLLMRRICTKLMTFETTLWTPDGQQQPLTLSEEFKMWLKGYMRTFTKVNGNPLTLIEYKINDGQLAISFETK